MTNFNYDIGIIGGGAAGLTITAGAAQLGAKTLLVEREPLLGGDCLHFGCVPSKTLIKSARIYHHMKNAPSFGLPAVSPPPVEFSAIAERIRKVIETIQEHDSDDRFCGLGARVVHGTAEFTDDHTIRLDGKSVSAKNWVVATGSSPMVLPIEGLDQVPYLTNKEIFSLKSLPGAMIILGAGPIAIEMAQAFSRLGTRVSVVQRSSQILTREDRDMADMLMAKLADEGIRFYLNTTVKKVSRKGRQKQVTLKDAENRILDISADEILVALGRMANLQDLALENAGVAFDPKGLKIDQRMKTSQKHIYGAGDATGQHLFTHAAGYEGGIVVSNAIFHLPRKADYTLLPRCTYSDPELAAIGLTEKAADAAGIPVRVLVEQFSQNDRSLAEGEKIGQLKMLLDEKESIRGIQILGPHAGELLNEWVAVLNGKVKLSTLASAIHPYPTLGEINKRVASTFFTPKIFSNGVKKGLKFFFNLKGSTSCQPGDD